MVSLETAEKALKTVYLGVVQDQLNVGVSPFMSKIEQTQSDVWGKEVVKLVPYGINGGIGAGSELGELPTPAANNYAQFRIDLKNLYGTFEITDKAIMASQHSEGAFVNLLNAEMEGLLKASKFNLDRMLHGDGTGILAKVTSANTGVVVPVDKINNLIEGMVVDFYKSSGAKYSKMSGRRIVSIDRVNKKITLSGSASDVDTLANNDYITVQKSKGYELTGLGAIFSNKDIYGLKRSENQWLNTQEVMYYGDMTRDYLQDGVDKLEEIAGSAADMILSSYSARKAYIENLAMNRYNLDYMVLDGGFKALTFNGIPVIGDRFIDDKIAYMVNTKDFKLHQLADWRWLEGDGGRVIKQKPGTPTYSATLVKYAELICDKPIGQLKLVNDPESI